MFISQERIDNAKKSCKTGAYYGFVAGITIAAACFVSSDMGCPKAFDWKTIGSAAAIVTSWEAYERQYGSLFGLKKSKIIDKLIN